jgi:hypothetical protein
MTPRIRVARGGFVSDTSACRSALNSEAEKTPEPLMLMQI